ncbi:MAG: 30S ribosomal protein S4 [Deltaproteobacteria bacterium]|jgi:small subunit ribosomal protein S4|nr:30S ribosomal protein S4 [Deltaproteobacteria bacterium]
MARYLGPKVKKLRSLGLDLPGLTTKSMQKRPYKPGQHGQKRRRRPSDHGRQLVEKQKIRFNYGVGEKQLRNLMKEARKSKVATGSKLAELLERRLDNTVFRAGFAKTIPGARQLVNHGHFLINGKKINIPSYRISENDEITLREKSKDLAVVDESISSPSVSVPEWLAVDTENKKAKISALPTVESVPFELDLQLVVEFYSKRM